LVEIAEDDVNTEKLTVLQKKAYLLPHAMSSFILWARENIEDIKKTFPEEFREKRKKASKGNMHGKLAEQVAFLHFAMTTVLEWMGEEGVVDNNRKIALTFRSWKVLMSLSERHNERLRSEDPVRRFLEILQALILQEKVRVSIKDSKDKVHDESDTLGGYNADHIGWFDEEYFYLLPVAIWNAMQRYCRAEGSHFPFKKNTLYKMLRSRKIIEASGPKNTIPFRTDGKVMKVLKICRRGIA
jgi:hypothetical protein